MPIKNKHAKNILIPIDLEDEYRESVREGVRIAKAQNMPVMLHNVIPENQVPPVPENSSSFDPAVHLEEESEILNAAQAQLDEIAESLSKSGVDVSYIIEPGIREKSTTQFVESNEPYMVVLPCCSDGETHMT